VNDAQRRATSPVVIRSSLMTKAMCAVLVAMGGTIVVALFNISGPGLGPVWTTVFVALSLILVFFSISAWRTVVVADDAGLLVRFVGRSDRIGWDEIEDFIIAPPQGGFIRLVHATLKAGGGREPLRGRTPLWATYLRSMGTLEQEQEALRSWLQPDGPESAP